MFYDFMTVVWCGIWGMIAGYITFQLATNDLTWAWTLGIIACVGTALLAYCVRYLRRPGR